MSELDKSYKHSRRGPSLKNFQFDLLKEQIQRVSRFTPLFQKKFEDAKVSIKDLINLEDLAKFPFTTKEDLCAEDLFANSTVSLGEIVRIHSSSGTTMQPQIVAYTKKDINIWAEIMCRCLRSVGVQSDDVVFITHDYGLFTGGLGVHYGAEKLGCMVVPTSSGQTKRQIQLILDLKATVLVGTPTYLLHLANELKKLNIGKLNLKLCICGAEPWSELIRSELQAAFAVKVFDLYGLSEVLGPGVASETIDSAEQLVVWEDHFYPEIINPNTLMPVAEGVEGELVITTLSKEACPLIRYRTGDLTTFVGSSIEQGFRTIARVKSRVDDVLNIKGVKIFPSQIDDILYRVCNAKVQYCAQVTKFEGNDKIVVFIDDKIDESLIAEAYSTLKSFVGITFELIQKDAGEIKINSAKKYPIYDLR